MGKLLILAFLSGILLFTGCTSKNDIDMTNPNSRIGKVKESINEEIAVDKVSILSNAKLIGSSDDLIEPSSSRKWYTTGGAALGGLAGATLLYGGSTVLGANVVDVSKIKIITNDNEEFTAFVQVKNFPINSIVQFEKPIDNEKPIELVQLKSLKDE